MKRKAPLVALAQLLLGHIRLVDDVYCENTFIFLGFPLS